MVRADGVDLVDFVAESDRLVGEELHELVRRGFARKQLELAVHRPCPRHNDPDCDLRGPRQKSGCEFKGEQRRRRVGLGDSAWRVRHENGRRTMIAPIGSRSVQKWSVS